MLVVPRISECFGHHDDLKLKTSTLPRGQVALKFELPKTQGVQRSSPTSSSCRAASSTSTLAAGCSTSSSWRMVAPSLVMVTSPTSSVGTFACQQPQLEVAGNVECPCLLLSPSLTSGLAVYQRPSTKVCKYLNLTSCTRMIYEKRL